MNAPADTDGAIGRIDEIRLREMLGRLPAIAIEGAKGVGKSFLASRLASSAFRLETGADRALVGADPARILSAPAPVLIDEWQLAPDTWNLVRRAVDEGAPPGSFLLTGSMSKAQPGVHSGAGRIVSLRMRPLSLAERLDQKPTVSLSGLLAGGSTPIEGGTAYGLADYMNEVVRSGFPGIRNRDTATREDLLDGYVDRIVERDFEEFGRRVNRPASLRRWMAAYAAATASTAKFEAIRDAATAGFGDKPSKATTIPYRDVLAGLWIIDEIPAWLPAGSHLRRLTAAPKHDLVDPALAARLLGIDAAALMDGRATSPLAPRSGLLLGPLFESLVAQSVRVYAESARARVSHLRTASGEHEVDLIVERRDGRILAIEVKAGQAPDADDARHLNWLERTIGDRLIDRLIVSTGPYAYRRPDGVAVVPAALLGP